MDTKFSFLVSTDNHMGFKHDDHLRRGDSFMAFREALEIARERDVDFILLGGDLFHMNKPNATIEHNCIKILRHHMNCPVEKKGPSFRRIAGEFSHFDLVKYGNFEDPSLSVPYPILTIHGNHDNPTGPAGKSVVEKLATCGLLNYFGKFEDKFIDMEPLVFEKDSIKLALYGLGFIPDRKLRLAWDKGLVTFKEPPKDTFNIMIMHQNRVAYSDDNYIPDAYLPNWLHLVIRGHEHDAIQPEIIPESQVKGLVYQPGSTVATSIEIRECTAKQVAIMTVELNQDHEYRLQPEIIDLKCHRTMIFRDIYQKDIFAHIKANDSRRKMTPNDYRNIFRAYVVEFINNALVEAEENDRDKPECLRLPLVRVRLEYKHKVECFDDMEVNVEFYPERVANRDIIKFRRQKITETSDGTKINETFKGNEEEDEVGDVEAINLQEERKDTIDTMIMDYFNNKPVSQRLKAISLSEYTQAVSGAAEDGNVISKVLAKKKNTVLFDYKNTLTDEDVATEHFGSEDKVYRWFLSAFKGEKPTLALGSNGSAVAGDELGGSGDEDDGDIDIVWDDNFKA